MLLGRGGPGGPGRGGRGWQWACAASARVPLPPASESGGSESESDSATRIMTRISLVALESESVTGKLQGFIVSCRSGPEYLAMIQHRRRRAESRAEA